MSPTNILGDIGIRGQLAKQGHATSWGNIKDRGEGIDTGVRMFGYTHIAQLFGVVASLLRRRWYE